MVQDCERGLINWVSNVKHLLFEFGFGSVWNNPKMLMLRCFVISLNKDLLTALRKNGKTT